MGQLDVLSVEALIGALGRPPAGGSLVLQSLAEHHRDDLRAACAEDLSVWQVYSINFGPDGFEAAFDALLADANRIAFAVVEAGTLVGMTAYIGADPQRRTVEIGNTYLRPSVRGSSLNDRLKALMIGHAFASGINRVELRVDARNARSQAAVAKIGGVREGVLREERVIWTGFVRDTVLFSILAREWPIPSTAG